MWTGFIGSEICAQLYKRIMNLYLITRYPSKYEAVKANNLRYISWDNPLNEVIDEADAVIHLAGEPVIGGRRTEEVKKKSTIPGSNQPSLSK